MHFLTFRKNLVCSIGIASFLCFMEGCTYPPKHLKQGECLSGSHQTYLYNWTRETAHVTLGIHPVVSIMMLPVAFVMLPLSLVVDTVTLPTDIWRESLFHRECANWMENPATLCEEYRQDSITQQQATGNTAPDDPTTRIPICIFEKRSSRTSYEAPPPPSRISFKRSSQSAFSDMGTLSSAVPFKRSFQ